MKHTKPTKWKEKFFKVIKIGDEPPLNKEGFWKKKETKFEQHDTKKAL